MPIKAKAPRSSIVDYVIDSLVDIGDVECKRFFSGWSLRLHGIQFAMVMRDQLYFSVDEPLRAELTASGSVPFTYGKAGRTVIVNKYQTVPLACLDDPDELRRWVIKLVKAG